VGCLVGWLPVGCGTGAVSLEEPTMSERTRGICEDLVADVPERVADLERREVEPDDAVGAAWGDPAIVLRCGVDGPADFDPMNGCTTVNDVDWYIPIEQLEANGDEDLTMTTIERDVAVEVTMPGEHWPPAAPLADLSDVVTEHTERTGRCT
jgi:hypothetical protein